MLVVIAYTGAIGVGTLSDSLIPYIGERLMGMTEAHVHIGFIDKWWIIHPVALLGVAAAYFFPATKLPHLSHIFVSTAASLFHMLMGMGGVLDPGLAAGVFVFLFLAVWLPCCLSDIVFPLLFIGEMLDPHPHHPCH